MSTEVNYISNVCVMGKKIIPQFKRELAALIYNFTCGIEKIEKFKGLAKLGNIVAETMFLVMFPGVAKLGNICFGRKICVREAKMFLTPGKNIVCF